MRNWTEFQLSPLASEISPMTDDVTKSTSLARLLIPLAYNSFMKGAPGCTGTSLGAQVGLTLYPFEQCQTFKSDTSEPRKQVQMPRFRKIRSFFIITPTSALSLV